MFALFYLIAIYISGSLKNYDRKYTLQRHLCRGAVNEYNLLLMKLFTVNEIIYR